MCLFDNPTVTIRHTYSWLVNQFVSDTGWISHCLNNILKWRCDSEEARVQVACSLDNPRSIWSPMAREWRAVETISWIHCRWRPGEGGQKAGWVAGWLGWLLKLLHVFIKLGIPFISRLARSCISACAFSSCSKLFQVFCSFLCWLQLMQCAGRHGAQWASQSLDWCYQCCICWEHLRCQHLPSSASAVFFCTVSWLNKSEDKGFAVLPLNTWEFGWHDMFRHVFFSKTFLETQPRLDCW